MDAMGAAIRVDARGDSVLRIMPELNEDVNEEWLSDKSRFIWDGLGRQRLDTPYVREGGRLRKADWGEAFETVKTALGEPTGVIAGDLIEVEQAKAALDLFRALGVQDTDCRPAGAGYGADGARERYLLNPTLAGVEEADALLLIGCNPAEEAAVWNARIRKAWLWNDLQVGLVGAPADLTYDYNHLGADPSVLNGFFKSDNKFAGVLRDAKRPMIVVGEAALCGPNGASLLDAAHALAGEFGALDEGWAGFGVLHSAAGRVGAMDVGFVPGQGGRDTGAILAATGSEIKTLVLLGADEAVAGFAKPQGATVIYVGHHGDAGAAMADVILPCAAYTEMAATYVNTEGRVQETSKAVSPKGEAREAWAIFRALSGVMDKPLPYDTRGALLEALRESAPSFAGLGFAPGADGRQALVDSLPSMPTLTSTTLQANSVDFYLTNPIARASKTMAECSQLKETLETPVAAE